MAAATPSRVKLPNQLQPVEDLLLWHDIPKSAAALGGATLLYLLLEWSGIPLMTWLSNVGLALALGCAIWALAAGATKLPGPKQYLPRVLTAGIDEAAARQAADKARSVLNHGLQLGGRVLSGEDLGLSLRAAVLLFFAARLGRIITPVGLLYLAVLALFTLPKVYELRKDELDAAHDAVRRQAGAVAAQARAQVGDVVSRLTPRKAAAAAGTGKAE